MQTKPKEGKKDGVPIKGNPNHPVTRAMQDEWYKICAILVYRLGGSATITVDDIASFATYERHNVLCHVRKESVELRLVDDIEGAELSKRAGGEVV